MLLELDWPPAVFQRRAVAGEAQWVEAIATFPPLTPRERTRIARQLGRRLLCVTPTGRRRLRAWLDAQQGQPITVEIQAVRRQRIAGALQFFGDGDVFRPVVETIGQLPRPVADYVVDTCMVLVTGRSTAGWTSGAFPDGRLPIMIAGHRTDAEIAKTLRHEVGHRWLIEAPGQAPTALRSARITRELDETYTPGFVKKFVDLGEAQAEWLAWSWSEP